MASSEPAGKVRHINTDVISRIARFSDGVVIEGTVRTLRTSGIPGFRRDGTLPSDFGEQANCAWENIAGILAAAGMSVANIVSVTHYLVRREDLPLYRRICEEQLGACRPASMLLFAAGLPWPEMLVELQVEAVDEKTGPQQA